MTIRRSDYSELIISSQDDRVSLIWNGDNYSCGNKIVAYSFPYENGEYIENLGRQAKKFNITAFIDVKYSTVNADKLERILSSGNILQLQLPLPINGQRFFESVELNGAYSINRSLNNGGVFECSIPLIETIGRPIYEEVANKGIFSKLSAKIFRGNEEVFKKTFNAINEVQSTFRAATDNVREVATGLRRASEVVSGSIDGLNDFISSTNELIDSAETLIRTPETLVSKITTTFNNIEATFDNAENLFAVAKQLATFDFQDTPSTPQQEQNNQAFVKTIRVNALAVQYQASVNINYTTQEDLQNIQSELENSYLNVIDLVRSDIDLYNSLQEARLLASEFLQDLSISLPFVYNKTIYKQPLSILVYNLYGNLDNKNLIQSLNNITDCMQVQGDIKVVSNVG